MNLSLWLLVPGLLLMAAGLLAFFIPAQAWQGMMKRGSRWANQASTSGLLLFAGLGLLGLVLAGVYGAAVWLGWRSTHWIEVEGVVVESRMIETRQIRSTNPAYRPEVIYTYEADGRRHHGMRVDLAGTTSNDRAWVEEMLATRFAPGARLMIRMNPAAPSQSVIEPGIPAKAWIFGGLGLMLMAIGGWQLALLLRDWEGDKLVPETPRRRRRRRRKPYKKSP